MRFLKGSWRGSQQLWDKFIFMIKLYPIMWQQHCGLLFFKVPLEVNAKIFMDGVWDLLRNNPVAGWGSGVGGAIYK